MGLVRTILAISVLFTHVGLVMIVGGRAAVQAFYIISGFLMSYIITERKAYPSYRAFYISRYARVFPQYIVIAVMTLIFFSLVKTAQSTQFFDTIGTVGLLGRLWLIIGNATLFTQDWLMFVGHQGGELLFSPSLQAAPHPLYHGLLLPQSWTLGVELTFYAIAPFVLTRRWLLFTLFAASISVRIALVFLGLVMVDPWKYRFFPAELSLFLIGALSHQFLLPAYRGRRLDRFNVGITAAMVVSLILFPVIPGGMSLKSALLIACFAAAMPALFLFQHGRSWDRWIGDLSYPIYINHMLIIGLLALTPIAGYPIVYAIVAVLVSIFSAILMNGVIGGPIDALRHRMRTRGQPTDK